MNAAYTKDKAVKKTNIFLAAIIMFMSLSPLFADTCSQSGNIVNKQTTTYVEVDGHVVPIVTATFTSGGCKESTKNPANSSVNMKQQEKYKNETKK